MKFTLGNFIFACTKADVHDIEFDVCDKNKDNKISVAEFQLYMQHKYGKPPTLKQWMRYHLADSDDDGFITSLDISLFEKHNKVL